MAHIRQQMGAAAAANATAAVAAATQGAYLAAAKAGSSLAMLAGGGEVDKSKLHFREAAGEKWVDAALGDWPESARPGPSAPARGAARRL